MSYADMMTLIACFFILMMAFANFDPVGFREKATVISESFTGKQISERNDSLSQLVYEFKTLDDFKDNTEIKQLDNAIELTFKGNILFKSGRSEIDPMTLPLVDTFIELVKQKNEKFHVVVEGHTDPIAAKKSIFPSNWELSSARAGAVIRRFEKLGYESDVMVAIGYSDKKPLVPNYDSKGVVIKKNLPLNRRVVIRLIKPFRINNAQRLGLGKLIKKETGVINVDDKIYLEK